MLRTDRKWDRRMKLTIVAIAAVFSLFLTAISPAEVAAQAAPQAAPQASEEYRLGPQDRVLVKVGRWRPAEHGSRLGLG